MRFRVSSMAVVGAALLTGVSATAAVQPHNYIVIIDAMKFGPVPPLLNAGDSITWVNRDFVRHSATATNRSFDVDLPPGARATTLIRTHGAVSFACRYHPGMRGVLQAQ